MISLPFLVLLAGAPCVQEEPLYRDRVEKLVRQLDGEARKEIEEAQREIGFLPSSLIPLVRSVATPGAYPRAASRLQDLLPPPPWHRVFKSNIAGARGHYDSIVKGAGHPYDQSVREVALGLACVPPEEMKSILDSLSASSEEAIKAVAAKVRRWIRPMDGAPYAKTLDSPVTCDLAAEMIILTGEVGAIPKAVEIFCRQENPESPAAARVLEALGAEGFVDRIAGVLGQESPPLYAEAVRILGRTGGPAAEKALRDALGGLKPGDRRAGPLVAELELLFGPDPSFRRFDAPRKGERRKGEFATDLASIKAELAKIRTDKSRIGPIRLKPMLRYSYPELKEDVLAWARDPSLAGQDLQYLLPLLGAVAGRDAAPLLKEKLALKPFGSTGAADGLALIGDPSYAPEVWKTFSEGGIILGTSMVAFPPSRLEDELVRHIEESNFISPRALQLIRMAPSPRLRGALFDRLSRMEELKMTWFEVPFFLEKGRDERERGIISALRKSEKHIPRMTGDYLAMRGGDAEAADSLAELLCRHDTFTLRNSRHTRYWRECEKAGPIWKEAVRKAWSRKPEWKEGLFELARWGDADAVEALRRELDQPGFQLREFGLVALAGRDDPAAVNWFLGRMLRSRPGPSADDDPYSILMELSSFRERLLVMARSTAFSGGGSGALSLLAERTVPEAATLYRLDAARGMTSSLLALVRLKDPAAYSLAVRWIQAGSASQRMAAAESLAALGNRAAVPRLLELIDDMEEGWDVRIERADPAIYETPPLRTPAHAAMDALEKLTGEKPEAASTAERRDFWRAWRAKHRDTAK